MTTLDGRPNTALLVIDVQNGVVGGAHERDSVVANVGSLVDRARREQVPVVWVQDDGPGRGSDDWQIVPELSPDDAEPRIEKAYADSFEETPLRACSPASGSADSSWSARRPTNASDRRCTAPWSGATTRRW